MYSLGSVALAEPFGALPHRWRVNETGEIA